MSGGGLLDDQFRDALVGSSGDYGLAWTILGETITYEVEGAPGTADSSSSITAVRQPTRDTIERDEDEQTIWIVSAADVSAPKEGDKITDDAGQEWWVIRVSPQVGGSFELFAVHSRER